MVTFTAKQVLEGRARIIEHYMSKDPELITININSDNQITLVKVYNITRNIFIGYCQNRLAIFKKEENEYCEIKVLCDYIVCPEWTDMIEKEYALEMYDCIQDAEYHNNL